MRREKIRKYQNIDGLLSLPSKDNFFGGNVGNLLIVISDMFII